MNNLTLFEIPETKPPSTVYINKLVADGFFHKNETYLKNYINANHKIALKHIKDKYIAYVETGKWSEEKFDFVLANAIDENKVLSGWTFIHFGTRYDEIYDKKESEENEIPVGDLEW